MSNLNQTYGNAGFGRYLRVAMAAKEYRQRIKRIAPAVGVTVSNREALTPIIEAARVLDAALNEV